MKLVHKLKKGIRDALHSVYKYDISWEVIVISPTEKKFEGTYTFTTFPLAGKLGSSPEKIAFEVGDWLLAQSAYVASYQVVKGFLNLTLSPAGWQEMVSEAHADLDRRMERTGEKMVIEFSSPNTNKPLHLGHLRNNFLGSALSNILEEVGHTVYKVNIINDRGIHICKSMVAYQLFGEGATPASMGMKGDHFVGHYYVLFEKAYQKEIAMLTEKLGSREQAKQEAPIMLAAQKMLEKWEADDQEVRTLWKKMNDWVYDGFEVTYKRTGTTFDKFYYESNTYLLGKEVVAEGLGKGIFEKRADGSVWADLAAANLDEKLVLRSNGTTVYITQDMGTIDQRYEEYQFDQHIYVVGSEQERHFQVLFEMMRRLGRTYADRLYHLSYGMVDLPSGKMKSREGTTVDADHLIEEMVGTAEHMTRALGKVEAFDEAESKKLYEMLGIGAIKYFLLRVNPKKRLLFNPEASIDFQGHTASFIQYTHARICTMLSKASQEVVEAPQVWSSSLEEAEKNLIFQLARFHDSLVAAAKAYNPTFIADYVYQLAKVYNHLYAAMPIIRAETRVVADQRLYLSWLTARTLKRGMALLGIEVPEKM